MDGVQWEEWRAFPVTGDRARAKLTPQGRWPEHERQPLASGTEDPGAQIMGPEFYHLSSITFSLSGVYASACCLLSLLLYSLTFPIQPSKMIAKQKENQNKRTSRAVVPSLPEGETLTGSSWGNAQPLGQSL